MIKDNHERLLLELFKEDKIINQNFSYISQISVITIKSLLPMTKEEGVRIDYKRLIEEIKLWQYYRLGENPSLLNIIGRVEPEVYWKAKDDSIISRIIPIVISNTKYEVIEEEIIKNVLFTTGNIESLIESISMGKLLYLVLEDKENIIERLKEKIIGFSQKDFLNKYGKYFRLDIDSYHGKYKVEFERNKIEVINILNGINSNRYENITGWLEILNGQEENNFSGIVLNNFINDSNYVYDIPKFYIDLSEYIIRLRKSRIDPKDLEVKEYILPDIFNFKQGDVFYHTLLKESKVIKKEVKDGTLTSLVQTRTGMYLFKK